MTSTAKRHAGCRGGAEQQARAENDPHGAGFARLALCHAQRDPVHRVVEITLRVPAGGGGLHLTGAVGCPRLDLVVAGLGERQGPAPVLPGTQIDRCIQFGGCPGGTEIDREIDRFDGPVS